MPHPNAINPATGRRYGWEAEQAKAKAESLDAVHQQIRLLKRQEMALKARDDFMTFIKFTMPDPEHPNDVTLSRYKNARHHDATAAAIEAVVDGRIPMLILVEPPRHGKSEQVSRRLPAWFMGKFPEQHGVVATYNDDFAADFGKEVRTILRTPQYRQIFPGTQLIRGGSASDRLQTTKGGQWSFVGRGGSLTGRGAHCFPVGTLVETDVGAVPIEQLTVSHKVLSYDERSRSFAWKAVEAVARRPRSRLLRITTAAGRVVEATSDHRFYAGGQWREARELAVGDRLLCAVRQDADAQGVRHHEALRPGESELLLLADVSRSGREPATLRRASMRALSETGATASVMGHTVDGADILLAGVHASGTGRGVRHASLGAHEAVRTLQRDVHADSLDAALLQQTVCVAGSRRAYAGQGQSALEGWRVGEPGETACDTPLSRDAAIGDETRRPALRLVRDEVEASRPSHRREPAEQPGQQSRDALPAVSQTGAQFRGEDDFVRHVEDTGRSAAVFDIQVEETACFFANGILAHNCLILDDIIKDANEANSQAIRDQAWNWFTKVAMSRRMGRKLVILTFTRWHADDPIGRLTDPENPHYNAALAARWKIISLPAIAEDDDPLERTPGEALWPDGPDKFDIDYLEEQRMLDPTGFEALYQGRPSALDGDLFKRENIGWYDPANLPANLRYYATSDHAVGLKQRNDPSCLLKGGVDNAGNLYLTECVWGRIPTDRVVEHMLAMGAQSKTNPLLWWAESGHISKSIGPFLRKRMLEENAFFSIVEIVPSADKPTRAQSIIGRVAVGKVFFPRGVAWAERAVNEMMAFPNGLHDDFVDALALFGLGLQSQWGPGKSKKEREREQRPPTLTFAWAKQVQAASEQEKARRYAGGF